MLYLRSLPWALRQAGRRAALAASAMAVAIAAAMVALAMRAGAAGELASVADSLGGDVLVVRPALLPPAPGRGTGWTRSTRLSLGDAAALRDLPGVLAVAPVGEARRPLAFDGRSHAGPVRGVTPDYLSLRGLAVAEGRPLDGADLAGAARVALVGDTVARRLSPDRSLVGQVVRVGGIPVTVVGRLRARGAGAGGGDEDDQVLVPLPTAQRRLGNARHLDSVLVQVAPGADRERLGQRIRDLLLARHARFGVGAEAVEVLDSVRGTRFRRQGEAVLAGMAALFALTTLAIGGGGILAVTWLNVRQRVPEIGLRMALGARRQQVGTQFLAEAGLLGLAGGVAGVALGVGAIALLRALTGWVLAPAWGDAGLCITIAALLGIVAGLGPAWRASRLPPLAALRG